MTGPGIVTLRTGAEVPEPTVRMVAAALGRLLGDPADLGEAVAGHEAIRLARDPDRVPYGKTAAVLRGTGLTDDAGAMHDDVRAVILACSEGDGPGFRLVSPYPGDSAPEAQR